MRADEVAAAFSGERLRLARFRAVLTIRDLGERAGVSHAAISQFESERTRPTSQTLAKLAVATGMPAGFFAYGRRPLSPSGLDGTHFRSLRSTTRAARAQAWAWSEIALDVAEALQRYVRLPQVSVPALAVAANAARQDMETAAQRLRDEWALPEGPVGHLVRHMETHGIVVARLGIANDGIDAFSHHQGPRPIVILETAKGDAARSRFDAAHELGHLVCHPEADPGGAQEQQAHAFAAELLMPRDQMLKLLPQRFDLGTYGRLKQDWGVSIRALLYRARTLEVISESAHRRASMLLNQRYGGRNEPFHLDDVEAPRLLSTAVDVAGNLGIPIERIAADAQVTLADLETLLGTPDARPVVDLTTPGADRQLRAVPSGAPT